MHTGEYTLIFGLAPKPGIIEMTDIQRAQALTRIKNAAIRHCGGYTLHFGQGGWVNPKGQRVEEEVAIVTLAGTWQAIQAVARIGKNATKRDAIYVRKPGGDTTLL